MWKPSGFYLKVECRWVLSFQNRCAWKTSVQYRSLKIRCLVWVCFNFEHTDRMTCAQKRGSKKLFFAFSNGDAIVNRFNRFSLMVWCLAGCLSVPCGQPSKTDVQTWARSAARTALLRRLCGRNVKLWKRILMVRLFALSTQCHLGANPLIWAD